MRNFLIMIVFVTGTLSVHSQPQNQQRTMNDVVDRNKNVVRLLLADAMPNGHFDVIRDIVSTECITRRAGFANLFATTGDVTPQKGNFLKWIEVGWKPLSEGLSNQHMEILELIGEGDLVLIRYHMTAVHTGKFVGVPATGRTVEWDEVATARFGPDGKIIELWFMCEELKVALQLGLTLSKN